MNIQTSELKGKIFEHKLEDWLQEILQKGNEYGRQIGLDFYPFQCSYNSLKPGVDLLIIGANPRGENKFSTRETVDSLFNCGINDENAYIANPKWKISAPILEMFSSERLRKILEKAIIMNAVYFNTSEVKDFQLLQKEANSFCIQMTKEFINILKPKAVLILGFDVPKWLNIRYNKEENGLLFSDETKKSALIFEIRGEMPVYIIHHPSRNYKFNNKENLNKKQVVFERILNRI